MALPELSEVVGLDVSNIPLVNVSIGDKPSGDEVAEPLRRVGV
jgi:hypothetical protein